MRNTDYSIHHLAFGEEDLREVADDLLRWVQDLTELVRSSCAPGEACARARGLQDRLVEIADSVADAWPDPEDVWRGGDE